MRRVAGLVKQLVQVVEADHLVAVAHRVLLGRRTQPGQQLGQVDAGEVGAQLQALSIAPTMVNESAIVATLPPGPYTAIVAGQSGTTGVGLIEVYDVQ